MTEFNWYKFLQDQGRAAERMEQIRKEVAEVKATLDKVQASQKAQEMLAASVKGAYKAIAVAGVFVGAVLTLVIRWMTGTN
jgi:hypothetical protein